MSDDRPVLVEVEEYGSEGYKPVLSDVNLCSLGEEGGCISSSGGSVCGGCYGTIDVGGREWCICNGA